jgi:hypothetical protein
MSSATIASTSPRSTASANRAASSRSRRESGSDARSRPPAGSAARARFSALVTESSVVSSMSATSAARNPRTSRRTSTARCRGGSDCTAAMNASEIDSVASYRASGTYTTMRQLGGAFGVAILGAVFAAADGYGSGQQVSDGYRPAVAVAAGLALVATVAGLALPRVRRPATLAAPGPVAAAASPPSR